MTAMPKRRRSGSIVGGFGWRGAGAGTVMPAEAAMISRRAADSAGRKERQDGAPEEAGDGGTVGGRHRRTRPCR